MEGKRSGLHLNTQISHHVGMQKQDPDVDMHLPATHAFIRVLFV